MHTIETVKQIYAAFGRGDIPAILEHIAQDADWEYAFGDHEVPWLKQRRGRSGALEFFQIVGRELDFQHFAVTHVVGDATLVVAVVELDAVVRKTGKLLRERGEAHLWHFDARGQIARFRHGADTLQHFRAYTG